MIPTNTHLANMLNSIGRLLKAKGANPHRIRAYHRAADTIVSIQEDIAEVAKRGELASLPGIGKDLSMKICEFIQTGTIQTYEKLKHPIPPEILAWTRLPGFSEPVVYDLYSHLGIRTLDDLEALTRTHLLRTRPGISSSTEDLLKAIHALREDMETELPLTGR